MPPPCRLRPAGSALQAASAFKSRSSATAVGGSVQLVRQRDGTVEIFKAGKAVAATKVRDRRQSYPPNAGAWPVRLHQAVAATVARQRQEIVQAVLAQIEARQETVSSAQVRLRIALPPTGIQGPIEPGRPGRAVAPAAERAMVPAGAWPVIVEGPPAAPRLLTATEFGARIGVTDETVRLREKSGELFSILAVGRQRGRRYPDFQQWPGVRGEPLKRVLGRLGPGCDGASAYQFFTSPTADLAGLSPLEVLLGQAMGNLPAQPRTSELMGAPAPVRLEHVEAAAEAFAAALAT